MGKCRAQCVCLLSEGFDKARVETFASSSVIMPAFLLRCAFELASTPIPLTRRILTHPHYTRTAQDAPFATQALGLPSSPRHSSRLSCRCAPPSNFLTPHLLTTTLWALPSPLIFCNHTPALQPAPYSTKSYFLALPWWRPLSEGERRVCRSARKKREGRVLLGTGRVEG